MPDIFSEAAVQLQAGLRMHSHCNLVSITISYKNENGKHFLAVTITEGEEFSLQTRVPLLAVPETTQSVAEIVTSYFLELFKEGNRQITAAYSSMFEAEPTPFNKYWERGGGTIKPN